MPSPPTQSDTERITWQEFDRRHAERYAKIMRREMTLEDALRENENDWRALVRQGESGRA